MNRVAWLPEGWSDVDAAAALSAEGFACLPLSEFRLRPTGRAGLVLGFAGMTEELIESGVQRMAEILRSHAPVPMRSPAPVPRELHSV